MQETHFSKKGRTNPINRNRHEEADSRRQRDQGGEKKNQHPNWKSNPNKRKNYNIETEISLEEKVWSGVVAVGATAGLIYVVSNDVTGVGIIDDVSIGPLIEIIWDNVGKVFA